MAQLVVGISDMAISTKPDDKLITYSLGSCLGVTVYDPAVTIGGMIHCLLPLSNASKKQPVENPCMYVNTGVSLLIKMLIRQGAKKDRLIIKAAGGAHMHGRTLLFNIGEKNFATLQKLLRANNMPLAGKDVGGTIPRTCMLDMATGRTSIRTFGQSKDI